MSHLRTLSASAVLLRCSSVCISLCVLLSLGTPALSAATLPAETVRAESSSEESTSTETAPTEQTPVEPTPADPTPAEQAMRVLDDFMTAFNDRDEAAWTKTMHFPHVRFASGATRVDQTADAMMSNFDFTAFAKQFNWHHSAWLSREVIQSGPDKAHVKVRFARYDTNGAVTTEFDSLYIVVKRDGRWGIVSRSSFAP